LMTQIGRIAVLLHSSIFDLAGMRTHDQFDQRPEG
jgi:hypothetical protein